MEYLSTGKEFIEWCLDDQLLQLQWDSISSRVLYEDAVFQSIISDISSVNIIRTHQ